MSTPGRIAPWVLLLHPALSTIISIPKCCPLGYIYNFNLSCVPVVDPSFAWQLLFYTYPSPNDLATNFSDYQLIEKPLNCGDDYYVEPFVNDEGEQEFYLLTNGTVHGLSDYCVDYEYVYDVQDGYAVVSTCFSEENDEEESDRYYQKIATILFSVGLIPSIICLLCTLVVLLLLPEKRNLHGKLVVSHVVSLNSLYVLLTMGMLGNFQGVSCKIIGILGHFFFITAFTWLTVMCFDMWKNFSNLTFSLERSGRGTRQFLVYCLFAFGVPTIILVTSIAIDYAPGISSSLRPKYGEPACWINGALKDLVYIYSPVVVLISINMVLFLMTALAIHRSQQDTRVARKSSSRRKKNVNFEKGRFALFLKLFLVMGVCWVMEVVSKLCQDLLQVHRVYFYFTDFINTLQGVFIFIVVVCKRPTLLKVLKRVAPNCKYVDSYTVSDAPTVSSRATNRTQEQEDAV